jgi:hypothetical protein
MKLAASLGTMRPAKLFHIGRQYRKEREIEPEEQARIMMILEYLELHPFPKAP